jgi:CRISPR-associated protein Cst2
MEAIVMAYPVLTGSVLIEANGAALNSAGRAESLRTENAIVVKQIRVGRFRFPYISGQAWRRWWRETLYSDFGWTPSEVIREAKNAYTKGDPIAFEEDDLFGYMVARKRQRGRGMEEREDIESAVGTNRRVSPLKSSPLISVLPNVITVDFGHFSRNLPPGADAVPFEFEHYTTFFQGVFTVSLTDVGCFAAGEMADLSVEVLKSHRDELHQIPGEQPVYLLPMSERVRRVRDVLLALAHLRGGACLARNLSDVSPVVVLVGFLNGGNAPFQRLFEPDENNERVLLNLPRLHSILEDYRDRLLVVAESKVVFFGYRPTVLANEADVLKEFQKDKLFSECIEVAGTPQQALKIAAELVGSIFEEYVCPGEEL